MVRELRQPGVHHHCWDTPRPGVIDLVPHQRDEGGNHQHGAVLAHESWELEGEALSKARRRHDQEVLPREHRVDDLPLSWPEGVSDDAIAGAFRLAPLDGGLVELSARRPGEAAFVPLYRMSREPQPIEAFAGMCAFHQADPASFFTRGPIATIALAQGRITLTADKVIVTHDGGRRETPYSADERASLLRQHFAIETP